jgi:hypothetical protein
MHDTTLCDKVFKGYCNKRKKNINDETSQKMFFLYFFNMMLNKKKIFHNILLFWFGLWYLTPFFCFLEVFS